MSQTENRTARILHSIKDTRQLPEAGTEDHFALLFFATIQAARTRRKLDDIAETNRMFVEVTFGGSEEEATRCFGAGGPYFTQEMYLANAFMRAAAYSDLSPLLLSTGKKTGFLTSDHPLAQYNQYCEAYGPGWGVTGAITQGLTVFLPLTPSLCLLLFDSEVYRVPVRKRHSLIYTSLKDLGQINQLQVVYAGHSLYFPKDTPDTHLKAALSAWDPTPSFHRSSSSRGS